MGIKQEELLEVYDETLIRYGILAEKVESELITLAEYEEWLNLSKDLDEMEEVLGYPEIDEKDL